MNGVQEIERFGSQVEDKSSGKTHLQGDLGGGLRTDRQRRIVPGIPGNGFVKLSFCSLTRQNGPNYTMPFYI